jgi:4a-hydroxytetrahydrobiopterin dehydratase
MRKSLSPKQFADTYELPDWHIIGRSIEALFQGGSFGRAAEFIRTIATIADEVDHHPDIDLRYRGQVRIVLSTHDANGLTKHDADLAARISAAANDLNMVASATLPSRSEIAIDAMDIGAILPFWRAVLGYVGDADELSDPTRVGPSVWFQQMDEPRSQRSRIHLDVLVPRGEADNRVAAALAAGGTLVTDRYARSFWVLADAEGNEACVCTWLDRP